MINGKTVEKLSEEIKELLKQRVENYIKAPEKVKTWDEVEQRLIKKYNYEI